MQAIFNSTLSQLPPSSYRASKGLSHRPYWRFAKKSRQRESPGLSLCSGGSLLITYGRGLLGHLHSGGLVVGAVGNLYRGSWVSMMVCALICVTGRDMQSCKLTEPTCLTRLEGVHVTVEMQRCFGAALNIMASGHHWRVRLLRCSRVCCRWCNLLAGSSQIAACTLSDESIQMSMFNCRLSWTFVVVASRIANATWWQQTVELHSCTETARCGLYGTQWKIVWINLKLVKQMSLLFLKWGRPCFFMLHPTTTDRVGKTKTV